MSEDGCRRTDVGCRTKSKIINHISAILTAKSAKDPQRALRGECVYAGMWNAVLSPPAVGQA